MACVVVKSFLCRSQGEYARLSECLHRGSTLTLQLVGDQQLHSDSGQAGQAPPSVQRTMHAWKVLTLDSLTEKPLES